MDIANKSILVLGGSGLVGMAVCRKLISESPRRLIITSIRKSEAIDAVHQLRLEHPVLSKDFFVPCWGNIFVRNELKEFTREEILCDSKKRKIFLDDIVGELTPDVLHSSWMYQIIHKYKPNLVIDCINPASVISYEDIFSTAHSVAQHLDDVKMSKEKNDTLSETVEQLLCTLYIPELIRYVQILYRSMNEVGTLLFVSIGRDNASSIGLSTALTNSEKHVSRALLTESAISGAYTFILSRMSRTTDSPITKELASSAAIAWEKIGFGEIKKNGKPIQLVDCPLEHGMTLKGTLTLQMDHVGLPVHEMLKSVFIDTGENRILSRGEFEAISTPGQTEFITPEEIAENVILEIRGNNTGHDIINALDNTAFKSSYRAGYLFNRAMTTMKQLEKENGVDSIAFETSGAPRLSKLLHEANLLRIAYTDFKSVLAADPKAISQKLESIITTNADLRTQIISIGIPILMPDGKTLLRANEIRVPASQGENIIKIKNDSINTWAHDGWVDLRLENMKTWKRRLSSIMTQVNSVSESDSSSQHIQTVDYWDQFRSIDAGKIAGWILMEEEKD